MATQGLSIIVFALSPSGDIIFLANATFTTGF